MPRAAAATTRRRARRRRTRAAVRQRAVRRDVLCTIVVNLPCARADRLRVALRPQPLRAVRVVLVRRAPHHARRALLLVDAEKVARALVQHAPPSGAFAAEPVEPLAAALAGGAHTTASHPLLRRLPPWHPRKHVAPGPPSAPGGSATNEPAGQEGKLQSLAVQPSSHAHVAKFGSARFPERHVPCPEHSSAVAEGHTARFVKDTANAMGSPAPGLYTAAFTPRPRTATRRARSIAPRRRARVSP